MPARVAAASGHALSTQAPANNAKLTNEGARSAGGLENLGTQTSNTFTQVEDIKCIETVNVPPATGNPPPYDGLETAAGPMISVTNISVPSSWTVPATGKTETLSGAPSAPNNTGYGTFDLFPDVKITIAADANTVTGGVGQASTKATITGSIKELDDWVVPWNPVDSTPNFDGSDFGKARSSGYGKEVGIFYITFTLKFYLLDFVDGPATASPIEFDYQIGVINNYDNDRDVYMAAYKKAYGSLTKVPELSEWQT
tara:strand:+ start:31 stop:798 length:768 start_codon:yes stop_codon:yes gene_type:complete